MTEGKRDKVESIYVRIGEAAAKLGVEPHTLRYWEERFPGINPQKTRSGQRIYTRKDIDALRQVQTLLHDQHYTIAGAKQKLRTMRGAAPESKPGSSGHPNAGPVVASSPKMRAALLDVRTEATALLAKWEQE